MRVVFLFLILLFFACSPEKTIDIEFPPYEPELVLECYLEPGKPYRLLLTESTPYEDGVQLKQIENASVKILHEDEEIVLNYFPLILDFEKQKFYNYFSSEVIPFNYDSPFYLQIEDSSGRILQAETKLLEPVEIKETYYDFDDEEYKALTVTTWEDNAAETNNYLYTLHKNKITKLKVKFTFNDHFSNGEELAVITEYQFEKGDTAIISLYHIDQEFNDYFNTTESARDSNGNPFVQPSVILSNVTGGRGIFTGLSFVRDTLFVQ